MKSAWTYTMATVFFRQLTAKMYRHIFIEKKPLFFFFSLYIPA